MQDSWCEPYFDGLQWLYGGAARNKRIKDGGGMDKICARVGESAAKMVLKEVSQITSNVVYMRRKKAA